MFRMRTFAAGLVCASIASSISAYGQETAEQEIAALKARVATLEQRLAELEKQVAAAGYADATSESAQQARRAKFEARMQRDLANHSREELQEAERLYQVANKNFGKREAKESLETMIAKYADLNRTGCAVLYMGQMSRGADRRSYLEQAADKYADCMYGDGVIVGAYARLLLAADYAAAGDKAKAEQLYGEIEKLYPGAVDHSGTPLAMMIRELRANP